MTIRVMGVGDSKTNGNNADLDPSLWTGYFPTLAAFAATAGWSLSLVGTQTTGAYHHEGHAGYRVDQLTALIAAAMASTLPDIILLEAGLNDIGNGEAPLLNGRMQSLWTTIAGVNPGCLILVSPLAPLGPAVNAYSRTNRDLFNTDLPGLVSTAQAAGQRVELAHAYDGISYPAGLSSDTVHPSQAGYATIGELWYAALVSYFAGLTVPAVSLATLEAEVYVSLDGSGAFTGDDDRLLGAVKSISLDEGRDGAQQLNPPKVQAGDVELRNEDGRFSPDRAESPYYQRLLPGKPVQYQAGHGQRRPYRSHVRYRDHLYDRGRGVWPLGRHVVDDLPQESEIGNRQVKLTTLGWEALLTRAPVTIPVMTAPRVDQCVTAYLDAVGWPSDKRDIAVSDTQLLYYWADERIPWDGMLQLLASEGPGAFGVRRDGTFYFENRNYRTIAPRSTTSQATFYDRLGGRRTRYRDHVLYRDRRLYRGRLDGLTHGSFRPASAFKSIYNRATYTTRRRTAAGSPSVIWSLGSDLDLTSTTARTYIVKPSDPFLEAITPTAPTDYTVAGGTVSVSLSATSGLVAFLTVTKTGGSPVVSNLQIRAKPLTAGSDTTVQNTVDASASIARHSPVPGQHIPLTYQVQGWPEVDPVVAEAVCNAWVLRYQESRPSVTVTIGNGDGDHLEQILKRRPSDRVTLVHQHSGISADFWINASRLTIAGAQGRTVALDVSAELCDTLTGAVWEVSAWDDLAAVWGV